MTKIANFKKKGFFDSFAAHTRWLKSYYFSFKSYVLSSKGICCQSDVYDFLLKTYDPKLLL